MTEIEIGTLIDKDEEENDRIVGVVFKDKGNSFITSVGLGLDLKLAIDTELAMPGTYTVEFVITEEINGEEFDYVKAVKIKIPGDEDEGNAD